MSSRDVRTSSAATLATATRSAPRRPARPLAPAHRPATLESLEARAMMDASYLYSGQESVLKLPTDRLGGTGANSNIVILDDLNGDGVKEIAASGTVTIKDDSGRPLASGLVRVFNGKDGSLIRQITKSAIEIDASFGFRLALGSDMDADGARDLMVSDFGYSTDGNSATIRVFSARTGSEITSYAIQTTDPNAVFSFGTVGDLDNDGLSDLVVSGSFQPEVGGNTVLYKAFSARSGALLWESAPSIITSGFSPRFTSDIVPIGDVTGDGKPDLLVGGDDLDGAAETRGAVFLISGSNGVLVRAWAVGTATNVAGTRVAFLGDVDGNGTGDFAVASYEPGSGTGPYVVKVSVYSLASSSLVTPIWVKESIPWAKETDESRIGFAPIGDVNDDGVRDLAIMADPSSPQSTLQIRSGRNGALIQEITGTNVVSDRSRTTGNFFFGSSVASGDLDGDGFDELLVGAQQAESPREGKTSSNPFVAVIPLMKFETPVVTRVNAAGVAFGTIAGRDFVTVDGVVTIAAMIPGLIANDIIFDRNNLGLAIGTNTAGDGSGFILDNGVRIELSTLARVDQFSTNEFFFAAAPGDYIFPVAMKLASNAKAALVKMIRDGTISTTWLLRRNAADTAYELVFLCGGEPGAISADGTAFGINGQGDATTHFITAQPRFGTEVYPTLLTITGSDISAVTRAGFTGTRRLDGQAVVSYFDTTLDAGTFTILILPKIDDANAVPLSIDRQLNVLASLSTPDGTQSVLFARTDTGTWTPTVLATEEWRRAPDFHTKSEVITPYSITSRGRIYATNGETIFSLDRRAALGPSELDASQVLATSPFGESGTVIVGLNNFGEILFFRRDSDSSPWTLEEITINASTGFTRIVGAVVWRVVGSIPTDTGIVSVAVATDAGVVFLTRSKDGVWDQLNLATLFPSDVPTITRSLRLLRDSFGFTILTGLTDANEVVIFRSAVPNPDTTSAWTFENLTRSIQEQFGLPNPNLRGDVITYITAWDALNIAGVNADGEPVVYWTTPTLPRWLFSNLAFATSDPSLARGFERIVANVLPWGGIGITSADAQLRTVWWAPGLGGTWQFASLVDAVTDGPRPTLVKDSVVAYSTTWGGQNITGIDANGRLWVYWWSPQSNRWAADSLQSAVPAFEGRTFTSRTSAYSVNAPAQTPMAVTAIDTFGHAVHLAFNVTTGWQGTDATDEWEMGA